MKNIILALLLVFPIILTESEFSSKFSLEDHKQLQQELNCMIVLIKHEAFNQSYQGMQAVAAVVVNRKQSKHYPESICAVAKQHKQFSGILKSFQAKPHRKSLNALEAKKAAQVSTIAYKAVVGRSDAFWRYSEIPKDVLWYHTKQVKPRWTAKLKVWGTIQDHVFYTKE